MLTGIFSTLLLPETKGKSLEELSNEDQEGFIKGEFLWHFTCPLAFMFPVGVAGRPALP
jgi:hypothetical protein